MDLKKFFTADYEVTVKPKLVTVCAAIIMLMAAAGIAANFQHITHTGAEWRLVVGIALAFAMLAGGVVMMVAKKRETTGLGFAICCVGVVIAMFLNHYMNGVINVAGVIMVLMLIALFPPSRRFMAYRKEDKQLIDGK